MVWVFVANLVPAVALYLWFKLTEKNLLNDWQAILKDGIASGVAILWLGLSVVICFEGWADYVGWFLVAWSITYWASAVIAWQRLQAAKKGQNPGRPLGEDAKQATSPNRAQRRRAARKR